MQSNKPSFFRQVKGELKKSLIRSEGKRNAVISTIAIVSIVILGFIFINLIGAFINETAPYTSRDFDFSQIDALIAEYEYRVGELENIPQMTGAALDEKSLLQIEYCKKSINVLKYVKQHKIDPRENTIVIYDIDGNNLSLTGLFFGLDGMPTAYIGTRSWSFEMFTVKSSAFGLLLVVIMVYSAIMVGTIFGDDYSKRTIRMLALRPITRQRILLVKTATAAIHLFVLAAFAFIVQLVMSALSTGLDFIPVVIGFGDGVLHLSPVVYLLWMFFNQYFVMLFYMTISISLCIIFKSKVLPIIVTTLLSQASTTLTLLANMSNIKNAYLLTFFPHTSLNAFFSNTEMFAGMHYLSSLLVLVVYGAIFTALSYYTFLKRDIM